MVKVIINDRYKQTGLDYQGETITDAIHALGHDEVQKVKVGKFFDVTLDPSKKDIDQAVKEISEQLLVNFNLETYRYEVMEEA